MLKPPFDETDEPVTTEPENLPEIQNKAEEEKQSIAELYELKAEQETQTTSEYSDEELMQPTDKSLEEELSLRKEEIEAGEKDMSEQIPEADHVKFDYDIKTPFGETDNSITTDPENLPEIDHDIENEKQPISEIYELNTDKKSQSSSEDQEDINPLKEQLFAAKTALQKGEFDTAVNIYNELIQAELMLDQVIEDIKQALDYQYPIEISLWQALGDAHLRNEQLEEALTAYSKAEELL